MSSSSMPSLFGSLWFIAMPLLFHAVLTPLCRCYLLLCLSSSVPRLPMLCLCKSSPFSPALCLCVSVPVVSTPRRAIAVRSDAQLRHRHAMPSPRLFSPGVPSRFIALAAPIHSLPPHVRPLLSSASAKPSPVPQLPCRSDPIEAIPLPCRPCLRIRSPYSAAATLVWPLRCRCVSVRLCSRLITCGSFLGPACPP